MSAGETESTRKIVSVCQSKRECVRVFSCLCIESEGTGKAGYISIGYEETGKKRQAILVLNLKRLRLH